jgi:hypothetical protein
LHLIFHLPVDFQYEGHYSNHICPPGTHICLSGYDGGVKDALREQLKREAAAEPEPQLGGLLTDLGGTLKGLGDLVGGLLNSVGNALVVGENKRPEKGYEFQAPGPGDSRGPCPGLNLLANCELSYCESRFEQD